MEAAQILVLVNWLPKLTVRYMWTLNRIQSKLRRMRGDVHLMCAQRRAVHVRAWAQHLCTALVPTISLHLMQHSCAALFFQCSRLRISRFTGPFDSSMNTSTRAHSDNRAIYADTVEHARLFKSISSVQRYSLQRSMRCFIGGAFRISRFTGPFDSSMNISTRAHSDTNNLCRQRWACSTV